MDNVGDEFAKSGRKQSSLTCYKHSWLSFLVLKINESFFFYPSELFLPYSKTFIDQACSVKKAEYKSLWRFFMNFHFVSIHHNTHTQKKKTQRMQQSSSLRLDKNEYLFAFINDRLSFSFTFLLLVPSIKQKGYCFKRWNVFLWI